MVLRFAGSTATAEPQNSDAAAQTRMAGPTEERFRKIIAITSGFAECLDLTQRYRQPPVFPALAVKAIVRTRQTVTAGVSPKVATLGVRGVVGQCAGVEHRSSTLRH